MGELGTWKKGRTEALTSSCARLQNERQQQQQISTMRVDANNGKLTKRVTALDCRTHERIHFKQNRVRLHLKKPAREEYTLKKNTPKDELGEKKTTQQKTPIR